jgi:hypothetical protein
MGVPADSVAGVTPSFFDYLHNQWVFMLSTRKTTAQNGTDSFAAESILITGGIQFDSDLLATV